MAVETLRPHGDYGVELETTYCGDGDYHYTEVDEAGAHDSDNTMVWEEEGSPAADLFDIQNSSVGAGEITKVTVKVVWKYQTQE